MRQISKQGIDNSNKFFKESEVDDTEGMLKYGVDLSDEDETEGKKPPVKNKGGLKSGD